MRRAAEWDVLQNGMCCKMRRAAEWDVLQNGMCCKMRRAAEWDNGRITKYMIWGCKNNMNRLSMSGNDATTNQCLGVLTGAYRFPFL